MTTKILIICNLLVSFFSIYKRCDYIKISHCKLNKKVPVIDIEFNIEHSFYSVIICHSIASEKEEK